jgi:hypothetical protein
MRWSWIYLPARTPLRLAGPRLLGNAAKDVEPLVSRHRPAVLQGQNCRPLLAELAKGPDASLNIAIDAEDVHLTLTANEAA